MWGEMYGIYDGLRIKMVGFVDGSGMQVKMKGVGWKFGASRYNCNSCHCTQILTLKTYNCDNLRNLEIES